METVLYRVHEHVAKIVLRNSSRRARVVIEYALLLLAISATMVLTHFHVKYATISGREYNLLEMKEKMSMHGGGEKSLKIKNHRVFA